MHTKELIEFVQNEITKTIDHATEEISFTGLWNEYETGAADGFILGCQTASIVAKHAIIQYRKERLSHLCKAKAWLKKIFN